MDESEWKEAYLLGIINVGERLNLHDEAKNTHHEEDKPINDSIDD